MKTLIILILTISFLLSSENISNNKKIVVGIRAWKGVHLAHKEWDATINFLNKNISGYKFELRPLVKYEDIKEEIKNKKIDFLFSDPVLYVESEHNYGVTRLATLQRKSKGLYFDKFGSVIFTSSKNKNVNNLKDTKNMVFMGVSKNALAGNRMAYREIINKGINPEKFFKSIEFSGGRGDVVVKKVLSNSNYLGNVRTGLLENMISKGVIKKDEIKIINHKNYEYFPFFVSTKLYSEFPFSKLSHVSDELSKKVLLALLSIKEDSKAAKDGKYSRWLIPSEYTEVMNLMKELNISIYKDFNNSITIKRVIQKYEVEFYIFVLSISILFILLFILQKQSNIIKKEKEKLTKLLESEQEYKKQIELQKNEFESIFHCSHDGVAIIDLDTNFLNFNNSFMKLTGYRREELLTKSCKDLTSFEYLEVNENAIEEAIKNGYANNFEKECIVNNNKRIFVNISISLLPDKKRLLLTLKDTSSQKIMEEQSKLASMGEMIGNIAHQWRQPLSAITASASGLQIQSEINNLEKDTLNNSLNLIINQANYLSDTIDNFRNFIKENNFKTKSSLKEIIDNTLYIIEASLTNNYIKVICDIDDSIELTINKNELIEAFINIINNSIDILKTKIKNEEDRFIFISSKKVNNSIVLSIDDTGGGILDDILHKVLEPYFTTKHQSRGTGLGLSITDKIIRERHNGVLNVSNKNIKYKNKTYRGASFSIVFNTNKNQ